MKYFPLNIVFLLISVCAFAQIENIPNADAQEMQIFMQNPTMQKEVSAEISSNQVFINQVGQDNRIEARIIAENSDVTYNQTGMNNYVDVNVNLKEYQSVVNQVGDNNQVFDQMWDTDASASLQLNQQGENLHFERFGSNSIGNNLEFNMTGNTRSIIVRNFN